MKDSLPKKTIVLRILQPISSFALCLFIFLAFLHLNKQLPKSPILPLDDAWTILTGPAEVKGKFLAPEEYGNIVNFVEGKKGYIEFSSRIFITDRIAKRNLGIYSPGCRIAAEFLVNGYSIGKEGTFPNAYGKNEFFSGTLAYAYKIPSYIIKTNEWNEIKVRIWVNAKGVFPRGMYISDYNEIHAFVEKRNFFYAKMIYGFACMGLVIALLYILLFVSRPAEKQYFSFAMLTLSSLLMFMPIYVSELIWGDYHIISYLTFNKIFLALASTVVIFFSAKFVMDFVGIYNNGFLRMNVTIVILIIIVIIPIKDYITFIKILPFVLSFAAIQWTAVFYVVIKALWDSKKRRLLRKYFGGFFPLFCMIIFDSIAHTTYSDFNLPVFSIYGWQLCLIDYLYILARQHSKVSSDYERLANDLEFEVMEKTRNLSLVNANLVAERKRAQEELAMAVKVQTAFLPDCDKQFEKWDLGVMYRPLSSVSGDFFDYYSFNGNLNGFSLFDISGHGVSAGLVSVLFKNEAYKQFEAGYKSSLSLTQIMQNINSAIIEAKGDVENYLTGVIARFGHTVGEDIVAEIVCGGHPSPVLYSAAENKCSLISPASVRTNFGMIGVKGLTPAFEAQVFTVFNKDILVFYSDGLTEQKNRDGDQFGVNRVMSIVEENHNEASRYILQELVDALYDFSDGLEIEDDITVVVMKRDKSADYLQEL